MPDDAADCFVDEETERTNAEALAVLDARAQPLIDKMKRRERGMLARRKRLEERLHEFKIPMLALHLMATEYAAAHGEEMPEGVVSAYDAAMDGIDALLLPVRASGNAECSECHAPYSEHPTDPDQEFLVLLCTGMLVKL